MDLFSSAEPESGVCSTGSNCTLHHTEKGKFDMVAIVRFITASLSIIGSLSIVCSAVYRKTVCNPKVHPIFVLSIVDSLLGILWICGAIVWLRGGLKGQNNLRVGCFTINLLTVILECVAMNVTLIYSLLAYSSIKQRDFSGVYVVQQRPVSVHVWHPLCSFTAYFIAWVLPVVLIMVPFGVIAKEYRIVHDANDCSCWCLPIFGNVIPRPNYSPTPAQKSYIKRLFYFIGSYSAVLAANYTFVFCCMAVTYYKVFRRIRGMIHTHERNENTPLYGATQAMILEGQRDAKRRVLLFFFSYILTGGMNLVFGVITAVAGFHTIYRGPQHILNFTYTLLVIEAILVPSQGFLNALAYGWTRGDFMSVMSTARHSRHRRQQQTDSLATSYDTLADNEEEEETEVEEEGGEGERAKNSIPSNMAQGFLPGERRTRAGTALTPVSP